MNLHFKIESDETKKQDFKLFCVTNKPCVFAKRVFRFLFTIFLRLRQHTCHSNEICISFAAWKVPIYFLQLCEFRLHVYKFVPRAARRTRSSGSPLTVKTISYLWELEWLAECSSKVWKFSGSGRHLSTSRLHLGASQTFCLRFHMFLHSSVLIKLKYDLRGKKIFTWLMVRPLRGLNSCITW